MSATALGLAARLARREVRHRPWRTLLVALLVAGPVAAMTFAAVMFRTDTPTPLEEWRRTNGAADAVVTERNGTQLASADLPPGSRAVGYQSDHRLLTVAGGRRVFSQLTNLPARDPLAAGVLRIRGRAPESAGEVLLSARAARTFGVGLGDTLDLDRPLDAALTVVGIGERVDSFDTYFAVLHPSVPFPVRPGDQVPVTHLIDLPAGFPSGERAAWAESHSATLSPLLREPDPFSEGDQAASQAIRWLWVAGAAALTVMGIVIASAFAAGARRQLTTLGQLAANGASPKVLRRVLVLQGSWTGLVGAVLGLGLGAAALVALAPHRERLLGRYEPSYDVHLADLWPIVLLGVLAATIAALVPARSASRIPVMAALAGRRPLGAVPPWLTVTGLAVSGAGLGLLALAMLGGRSTTEGGGEVWALVAILGEVTLLLGLCAVAPGYVSVLGPAAARLGGSWRLAARSLARQRSRTGAVVSAVCATTALALTWSAVINAASAREQNTRMPDDRVLVTSRVGKPIPGPARAAPTLIPPPAAFVDGIRDVLVDAQALQLSWVPTADRLASVADTTFLDALDIGAAGRGTLARTGVAVLGEGSGVESVTFTPPDGRPPVTVQAPVVDRVQDWQGNVPRVLITPERAAALGLTPRPGDIVLLQPRPLTADQRDAVEAVFEDWIDANVPRTLPDGVDNFRISMVEYARPNFAPDPFLLDAILAGVSLLFVLFVVASSLALAGAETRSERDLLTVMGASPKVIRRTSGVKAVVLTVFGVVLALPAGLLPVLLFSRISDDDMPFVFPWRAVLLVVVAVPVLAGLATTTTSALALRLRPVRTSTMTFE